MKHFPLLILAAVLVAAVSAPAQFSMEGRIGRQPRASVGFGGEPVHRQHSKPVRRHPVQQRGHWTTVHEQVLVPGYWHDEHRAPSYGWTIDLCGHRLWGVIDGGGCRRVWVPARWETRCRQVWVGC